ncbi:stage VI sporulation protein F [Salinibacillus xinjiangensis]|uniref:Stage VI sporulation protein F n=1 Tax=Salinibacillus xinjiangensis TaxID=1229268 RepID=A0A6G1X8H6_9BACI|nr:stage VI sporulation protein F [Salinibacillus xinjiangensis]MRG87205.1 stage VI sporulation protein F [Salinibacillus xinjiangensis]
MNQDMLKKVEKKTGVDMQSILRLASAYDGKGLENEKTARRLVRQVGKLAGKKVPRETEDQLVKMITQKKINESTIRKMTR